MENPFELLAFNEENLAIALCNKITSVNKVKQKTHFKYFLQYLSASDEGLGAKTILIENKYISKSYLLDFSNYYSTCFKDYGRFSHRVHFFSVEFDQDEFWQKLIYNPNPDFWENYLGCIVVKPLPNATIGATILKTFYREGVTRHFPATKKHTINLFGKDLTIDSLAFLEQDTVVGACASSALWSAFQKTSSLFQTPLPSPSEITKSAKNLYFTNGRTFPNDGLDHFQIGSAIEAVGLVTELRNSKTIKDLSYLKSFIYAYNKMGLPILLGIALENRGLHLITVVGYREGKKEFTASDKMSTKAELIERFYAHDDQIGPFSKLGFTDDGKIETSWDNADGTGKITSALSSVFVPLYHKIRIRYEDIYEKIRYVDFFLDESFKGNEFVWDIFLYSSNNYKEDLLKSEIPLIFRRRLSTMPMPKYIWIAKCFIQEECIMEIIFDSTDIKSSDYCLAINIYNNSLRDFLTERFEVPEIDEYFKSTLSASYKSLFNEGLVNS